MSAARNASATDRQLRKLRFYGNCAVGTLTKLQASILIEHVVSLRPELEKEYRVWADAEDDLLFWHRSAINSDFCQEGDVKKPTRELVKEMIRHLDKAEPEWRAHTGGNAFTNHLLAYFPQLGTRK